MILAVQEASLKYSMYPTLRVYGNSIPAAQ